jgi:hypothetical protein
MTGSVNDIASSKPHRWLECILLSSNIQMLLAQASICRVCVCVCIHLSVLNLTRLLAQTASQAAYSIPVCCSYLLQDVHHCSCTQESEGNWTKL